MTDIEYQLKKQIDKGIGLLKSEQIVKLAFIASVIILSYLIGLFSLLNSKWFWGKSIGVFRVSASIFVVAIIVLMIFSTKIHATEIVTKECKKHLSTAEKLLRYFHSDSLIDIETFIQHLVIDRQKALNDFRQFAFPLISAINLLVVLPLISFVSASLSNLVTTTITIDNLQVVLLFFAILLAIASVTVAVEYWIVSAFQGYLKGKNAILQSLLEDLVFIKRHPPITISEFAMLLSAKG
ncbi:hypothetical protein [Lacticaseibacillus sp. N501-2]|uniref:hypothetical protein n=1 Tax=Lacticaseibacillus salsurae TaxID=3367729 RepID=UPI0038B2556D